MYKLKDLKVFKVPGRKRCYISRGRVIADLAIANTTTHYGKWFYVNRKVLLQAVKHSDPSIKKEIYDLIKDDFLERIPFDDELKYEKEEVEVKVNLEEVLDGEQPAFKLDLNMFKQEEKEIEEIEEVIEEVIEEDNLDLLSLDELFELAKSLEIATRKNNTKETLIKKIKEHKGE